MKTGRNPEYQYAIADHQENTLVVLNAFLLPAPVGGEIGTASTALNDWGSIVAAGGDGESNAAPHVSVNIILFDKNYNLLDAAYDQIDAGAEQVGVTPLVAHDYLTKEYTVKEEGYVFMYVANENATQVDAYFDDVTMTYTPTNVVQYNDYYPFGLQTSTSWTRDDNKNNFLYNQGGELNATTGLYDLTYRNYDPAIGRFQQVDPLAAQYHSYSTYNYALNNPVMMNDPNGAKANDPQGARSDLDKAMGRLEAWADFMDSFNPYYSGSHGGGGGSGYGQWYRYSQYYAEAQSSYNNDLIARAKSGDANAIGEYSVRYGVSNAEAMQFFASSIGGSYYGGNEMAINPGRPDANGGMVVDGIPYVVTIGQAHAGIWTGGTDNFDRSSVFLGLKGLGADLMLKYWEGLNGNAKLAESKNIAKLLRGYNFNVPTKVIKNGMSGVLKGAGKLLGIAGGLVTVGQVFYNQEIKASNILDLTMTGLSFIPGAGWVIGGTYFIADLAVRQITDKSIGEHLDESLGGGSLVKF